MKCNQVSEAPDMRILAIGDIHSCSVALDALLDSVRPDASDLIVTLGDYVDRGPHSIGVIDRLVHLKKNTQVVPLCGNHEQMMLEARDDEGKFKEWLKNGGDATLASYSMLDDAGTLSDVHDNHWDFLAACVDWHETPTHFFVHANAYADYPLAEQPSYMLRWEKFDDPAPHMSGKVMVCGHTPQKGGVPRNIGHAVCIDTWAHGRGWLTCLDVTTGKVWQANQLGERRTSWIEDFAANA
jgi:Calcineurin-like phosphoesterase